ncbi:hypothetical protein PanWU01x14_238930 [Parasponia andersonii]|uniref:Uncharacterized protein n=1 Tax=Parasponia andersonii TaxID=3476 RepID=A0A2P5BHL3_PARAD|nr:hypothetical protein PanWU01x14_238930 [Parasponia andersonii]
MTKIRSGLRVLPSILDSRSKLRTLESISPSKKGEKKVDTSRNSPPPQPTQAVSQLEPSNKQSTSSSSGVPSQADKDTELLALLRQLS